MQEGLESLVWLAGHWSSNIEAAAETGPSNEDAGAVPPRPTHLDGTCSEEIWLPPRGGLMLGLHRDVFPSGQAFFEYLRIEECEGGIVYQASPSGRPPTPFYLVAEGPQRAVFANPEHDFPKQITYWRDEAGALHARIEGAAGDPEPSEWIWQRL